MTVRFISGQLVDRFAQLHAVYTPALRSFLHAVQQHVALTSLIADQDLLPEISRHLTQVQKLNFRGPPYHRIATLHHNAKVFGRTKN